MDALVAAAAVHGADSPPADLVLEAAGHHALVAPELSRRLSKHQVVGVQWLYGAFHGAHNPGWRGCLLADGMGVGKTLQALTLLHTLLECGEATSALVVVPSSLVQNWQREVEKFTPGLAVTYVGMGAQCTHALRALRALRDAEPGAPAPRVERSSSGSARIRW